MYSSVCLMSLDCQECQWGSVLKGNAKENKAGLLHKHSTVISDIIGLHPSSCSDSLEHRNQTFNFLEKYTTKNVLSRQLFIFFQKAGDNYIESWYIVLVLFWFSKWVINKFFKLKLEQQLQFSRFILGKCVGSYLGMTIYLLIYKVQAVENSTELVIKHWQISYALWWLIFC